MCAQFDIGTACRVARLLFGSQDIEWLGRCGIVGEVSGPFRLFADSSGDWCIRIDDELGEIDAANQLADATAPAVGERETTAAEPTAA